MANLLANPWQNEFRNTITAFQWRGINFITVTAFQRRGINFALQLQRSSGGELIRITVTEFAAYGINSVIISGGMVCM